MILLSCLSNFYCSFRQRSKLPEAKNINKEQKGFPELYFCFYKIINQDRDIFVAPP